MSHPESMSRIQLGVDIMEKIVRESFRMAERIVEERISLMSWTSDDARDRYRAVIPLLALDIAGQLKSFQGIDQAPQRALRRKPTSIQDASVSASRSRRW